MRKLIFIFIFCPIVVTGKEVRVSTSQELISAVQNAEESDHITITAGRYSILNLEINSSIILSGENYPVLDAGMKGEILIVNASDVIIEGIQFENVGQSSLYAYDAFIHSFFIGFVLNMILAHAPIIFPSVLGVSKKPFHQFFYFWLVLLHVSIVARLYGDFSGDSWFRKFGGVLNGVSFLGYLGNVAILLITQKTKVSYL